VESCEYQLLKSFGVTRPGNRTLVYRLRGALTTEPPRRFSAFKKTTDEMDFSYETNESLWSVNKGYTYHFPENLTLKGY